MLVQEFNDRLSDIVVRTARLNNPVLIAIAGGTCSGKTYLGECLSRRPLEGGWLSTTVIPLDAYFKNIDDDSLPKNEHGHLLFDLPDSYRQVKYLRDVLSLLRGKSIYLPNYDIESNRILSDNGTLLRPNPIIIAEGLFAIKILNNCWPNLIRVYVEVSIELMLSRKITRDTALLGVTREMVERVFCNNVLPYHKEFVVPQRDLADIIVKGEGGDDL